MTIIDGVLSDDRYRHYWKKALIELDIIDAQNSKNKKNIFLYRHDDDLAVISVWTSPKRTKTNPLPRVFSTLGHSGKKITIIPVLKEEGVSGEQNLIHANTVYWMSSLGVYVIIGYYTKAILGTVGKQSSNAKEGKPSNEGKPKFADQVLNLNDIRRQINLIMTGNSDVNIWNSRQIQQIPKLLQKSIETYEEMGIKHNVPLKKQALEKKKKKAQVWGMDIRIMFDDFTRDEIAAQNRETKTDHKHEDIPEDYGGKGKFNIQCRESEILYLTADAVSIDEDSKVITITEAKNTTKKDFPSDDDIRDDLMKLMLFKKSKFTIKGEKYEKKLRCCLKGKGTSKAFEEKFVELIRECNVNEIELRFNNKEIIST